MKKRRKYNNPTFTIGTSKSDPPIGTCSNCKKKDVGLYETRYKYKLKSDMWEEYDFHIEIVQYCHNCNSLPSKKIKVYQNGKLKTFNADKYIDLEICRHCHYKQNKNHMLGCYLGNTKSGSDIDTCKSFTFDYQIEIIQALGIKI